jgi:hypothetical protein
MASNTPRASKRFRTIPSVMHRELPLGKGPIAANPDYTRALESDVPVCLRKYFRCKRPFRLVFIPASATGSPFSPAEARS